MLEIIILKSMLDYNYYNKYFNIISQIRDLEKEYISILRSIQEYYNKYPDKKEITVDEIETYYKTKNPFKKDEIANTIFNDLKKVEINNEELIKDSLNKLAERYIAYRISLLAEEGMTGTSEGVIPEIEKQIANYYSLLEEITQEDQNIVDESLSELLQEDKDSGLKWRCTFLQETFGGVKPGTLIHFFAYSEVGKTTLGISEATYQARQLKGTDEKILYLGNEEPLKRTKLRAYCALCGTNKIGLDKNVEKAEKFWKENGGNNLVFLDNVITINMVEAYMEKFKPRIVWIDQGPKVNPTHKIDSRVERLQVLYNQYRKLAKKHQCAIITLGQADKDAEKRKWLSATNVDGSKVGLQGECDGLVGIGKIMDPEHEHIRYLSICKNKLTGILGRGTAVFVKERFRYE